MSQKTMMTCASSVQMVGNLCFVMAVQEPFTKVVMFISTLCYTIFSSVNCQIRNLLLSFMHFLLNP